MAKIKKVYQKRFTTVDNTILNDESVSWKAKGLFTYLWSKPDNWNYSVKEVSKHAKDGRDSTSDGVQELEEHGYLKREQINKKGSFGSSVWTLSERPIFKKQVKNDKPATPNTDNPLTEEPVTVNPSTDLPMTEKSSTENPALLNTDSTNNGITNKDDDDSVHARKDEQVHDEDPFNVATKMGINVNSGFHMPIFVEFIQTLSSPVVCWALHKTDDGAEHPNWTYLLTILKDLEANSVRTVEQAERYAEEYNRKKKSKGQSRSNYRNRQPIKEPMPAWWDKQQKEETKPQQHTEKIDDSGDPMPDD
ncbi:DnaD domain protein [Limosilactobacillus reuteri]|uniref:helix-turn-helix domain-containing protein n=1 Tax=Limosilactobacillus reuteri TaxID=1598 RepID=UPI00254CF36A|nr:helix-turn-helix domain-containing protein [Limosilactobacillus reuteri]MDK8117358.1 DnaD domain protein [Limosilactobacillus reuteri]